MFSTLWRCLKGVNLPVCFDNWKTVVSDAADQISLAGRQNLKVIEETLRKQWRMGQNIALCWSHNERGLLVLFVPHYFLGNYSAANVSDSEGGEDNETYIRRLISGSREYDRTAFFAVADRLGVAPTFIRPESPLGDSDPMRAALDQLIRRYGLSYVEHRAVILFDIAGFSLYSPFEQASQLNSLSYSMNSAYNKLQTLGVNVPFRRTTTGDGYYVWHSEVNAEANRDLFYFLLLIVADNAAARAVAQGNTVPRIRAAFHIGDHYELFQAEGVNPTVFSYIVGDVTIDLARMLNSAKPEQILVGEFPARAGQPATADFIDHSLRSGAVLNGLRIAGLDVDRFEWAASRTAENRLARYKITDKHGFTHFAYNLEVEVAAGTQIVNLGLKPALKSV
jgi:hypothetical protein